MSARETFGSCPAQVYRSQITSPRAEEARPMAMSAGTRRCPGGDEYAPSAATRGAPRMTTRYGVSPRGPDDRTRCATTRAAVTTQSTIAGRDGVRTATSVYLSVPLRVGRRPRPRPDLPCVSPAVPTPDEVSSGCFLAGVRLSRCQRLSRDE